jgi:hypothetical protein
MAHGVYDVHAVLNSTSFKLSDVNFWGIARFICSTAKRQYRGYADGKLRTHFEVRGLRITSFLSLLSYIKKNSAPFISLPIPTATHEVAGAEKWKYKSDEFAGTLSEKSVFLSSRYTVDAGGISADIRRGNGSVRSKIWIMSGNIMMTQG